MKEIWAKDPEKVKRYEQFLQIDNKSSDSLDLGDNEISFEPEGQEMTRVSNEPQPWCIETLISLLLKD